MYRKEYTTKQSWEQNQKQNKAAHLARSNKLFKQFTLHLHTKVLLLQNPCYFSNKGTNEYIRVVGQSVWSAMQNPRSLEKSPLFCFRTNPPSQIDNTLPRHKHPCNTKSIKNRNSEFTVNRTMNKSGLIMSSSLKIWYCQYVIHAAA